MKKTIGLLSIFLSLVIASYATLFDKSHFYNKTSTISVSRLPNPLITTRGITHNPTDSDYRAANWIPEYRVIIPPDQVITSSTWTIYPSGYIDATTYIDYETRVESVELMDREAYEAMKEAEWQESKSYMLKVIENTYIDFLENMWTTALRDAGLIAIDYTITVDNTTEQQNINYLLQLRSLNFDDYNTCASEFSRFKSTILENGGVMAKVKLHDL